MHLPLSGLFEALAKIKQDGLITEFDVTRATLEQVFQAFARFQLGRNEHEAEIVVDGVIVSKAEEGGNQVEPEVVWGQ